MAEDYRKMFEDPTSKVKSTVQNDKENVLKYSEEVITETGFIWQIPNFSWQKLKEDGGIESDDIEIDSCADRIWRMKAMAYTDDVGENLAISLNLKETCSPINASYMFYILHKHIEFPVVKMLHKGKEGRLVNGVVTLECLEKKLPDVFTRNSNLNILCKINIVEPAEKCGIIRDLDFLFRSGQNADVMLEVNGVQFPAHGCILCARSQVLAKMLEHNMTESKKNVMVIPDVEPNVFEEMLRFIYTDIVNDLDAVALELLIVADKYGLDDLKLKCENALFRIMDVENVVTLLIQADLSRSQRLKDYAKKYIIYNAREVVGTKAYNEVGKEHMHLLTAIFRPEE